MNIAQRVRLLPRSWGGWFSFLNLGVGSFMLLGAGAYTGYAFYAQTQLWRLVQRAEPPVPVVSQPGGAEEMASLSFAGALVTEAPGQHEGDVTLPAEAAREAPLRAPALTLSLPQPPATHIVIPSIGVDSPIVELDVAWRDGELVWQTAAHAVGHYKKTANPGEPGNVVMSGHISSPVKGEGEVFKNLPKIKLGDEVFLFTEEAHYRYRVVATEVVLPTETQVMAATPYPVLTLITCVPDFVYSHRLIVRAEPVDRASYAEGDVAHPF